MNKRDPSDDSNSDGGDNSLDRHKVLRNGPLKFSSVPRFIGHQNKTPGSALGFTPMGPSPQANNLINGAPNRVNLNRVNADGEEESEFDPLSAAADEALGSWNELPTGGGGEIEGGGGSHGEARKA